MSVQLNHTIVWCRDKQKSATFLTDILGLPAPTRFGPFLVVELSNSASLDFHETDGEIASQHYAFLIGEDDFDQVFGRIRERGLEYWADPAYTAEARSTATMVAEGCTSKTPTVISWRSSHASMGAACQARSRFGQQRHENRHLQRQRHQQSTAAASRMA